MRIRLLALALMLTAPALAQFDPEDAEVISYYPHVADGGPVSQRWTTTVTLVNPHSTFLASGTVYLYDDNGKPMFLDFGAGPQSSLYFAIPAQGRVQFTSTGAAPNIVVGWAMVTSTLPVQGVLRLVFSANGVPQQGVSEQTTRASALFRSPATTTTGVAIANQNPTSLTVTVSALDFHGKALAVASVTLAALGHTALTVGQFFPTLPSSFSGSVLVATTVPDTFCVVWTLGADLGALTADPPSGLAWPVSQYERIWKVWNKLISVASTDYPLPVLPKLMIDPSNSDINVVAKPPQNQIDLFLNVAEMMSDSDSELAYILGHALGHLLQYKDGKLFVPTDIEEDADDWAIALALQSGYDHYGAAGALGKLSMASSTAGLLDPNFDNLQAVVGLDLHGSFTNRLANLFDGMLQVCGSPLYQPLCNTYKTIHAHVPTPAPLAVKTKAAGPLP